MVFILKEEIATKIFENYRNVAAFTLSKGMKGITVDGMEVSYEKLNFLPDEDTINAIKSGDMKLKKVIKKAVKALHSPSMENATIGLGMIQLITILTNNRKSKHGPAIIVFVVNDNDVARNKIMIKYIEALLGEFGLKPITKAKTVCKLFKKRKKAKSKVMEYTRSDKSGCNMSKKGAELKQLNQVFYELELRQSSLINLDPRDLDGNAAEACVKSLLKVYTAENLKAVDKKIAKRLAKKDKMAVKAYNILADILKNMNYDIDMPKIKYGQKKKHGEAVGSKMKEKKFKKYFTKKRNRGILLMVYAHTLTMLLGIDVGSKEYNSYMKSVCNNALMPDGFAKDFSAAVGTYVKTEKSDNDR